MNRKAICLMAAFMATSASLAQHTVTVTMRNNLKCELKDVPATISLKEFYGTRSATVIENGKEIPYQIDDFDKDGNADELCFLTDLKGKETKTVTVTLSDNVQTKEWTPRTFAEIVLRNPSVKEKNKHDIYLSSVTIDKRTTNPYNVLHHHGVAFESELIGMRIYMDKRQTIDLYGKFHKGLEIEKTQFYTSKEQKTQGYGDDVLWVGNTFGLGAFRGWDGSAPTMLEDVEHRTQRIVATGPLRTIVEVEDNGWTIRKGDQPVNATIRYTLYAGHRDFDVDVTFNRNVEEYDFSTGIINVKNSVELTNGKGLRGCWGTDWPAGTSDTINWKLETVGLGIYVPDEYRKQEIPANKDNYAYVIACKNNQLHYSLVYTSDNEDFGYHSDKEWFCFLKEWKKQKQNPVTISIKQQ